MSQSDKKAFLILSLFQTIIKTSEIYAGENETILSLIQRTMNEYSKLINHLTKDELKSFEIILAQMYHNLTTIKFVIHQDLIGRLLIFYSEIFIKFTKGGKNDGWTDIKTFAVSKLNLETKFDLKPIIQIIYKYTKIGKNETVQ